MMSRAQILLPKDLLESAQIYAASQDLSFSELVRKSLATKVKIKEKVSVYVAFKKLAKIIGKRHVKKLPPGHFHLLVPVEPVIHSFQCFKMVPI